MNANQKMVESVPKRLRRWDAILEVWHEFCDMSSMHGVRFLGDTSVGILAKILWAVALVTSATVLSIRTERLTDAMYSAPLEIRVLSTRTALQDVPYPSIIFCPTTQLVKARAFKLLTEYLEANHPPGTFNPQDPTILKGMNETYETLLRFHYPTMMDIKASVERIEAIFQDTLYNLDLEDFFQKTVPTCDEIFEMCEWHGLKVDCCQVLQRQVSSLGFCFAFNSLVTLPRRNCTAATHNDIGNNSSCFLRHSATSGAFSGLTVTIKKTPEMMSESDGLWVSVVDPTSLPLSGGFHRLQFTPGRLTQMTVTTVITEALEEVRKIPLSRRNCQFKDERYGAFDTDTVEKSYSKYNCITRCGTMWSVRECKCRAHLVDPFLTDYVGQDCNFSHFRCISHLSNVGKCKCKPRCEDLTFSTEILHKSIPKNNCVIDIFYMSGDGLLMYQRQLSIDTYSVVVSFGGLAGLLLGCSVLSMAELVYYCGRAVTALIVPRELETSRKDKVVSTPGEDTVSTLEVSTFPWYP